MFNPYQQQFSNFPQTQNMLPQQQILQSNGKPTFDAYKLAPNSSVLVVDSTAPIVWKCVADGLGNVTMEAFDITPHKDEPKMNDAEVKAILVDLNNIGCFICQ